MTRILMVHGVRHAVELHPYGAGFEWKLRSGTTGWFKGDLETVVAAVERFLEGSSRRRKA